MKKSFLKKLAFVMAFATVSTSLAPAAGVLAASTPSLNAKSKTLLLNDEDRTEYDFNVANKVKGSTYKWTTSNKKVATVDAKTGLVEAQTIGTVKITCKITLPTKKTKTLTATVTVKENIDTLTIDNPAKEAIAVGDSYNFNYDYTTVTGGKTTDKVKFEVTKGADKASIKSNGVFTATEAGEYEVVALAFQSEAKYKEYLAGNTDVVTAKSEPTTIKVKVSLKETTLKKPSQIELKFDSSVKDIVKSAADVKIETVATNKSIVPVKGIESISEDGKTVLVNTYAKFANDITYKVTAAESTVEFKAQIGTINTITIDNQTVAPINNLANAKTLKYTVKDIYGVDVTENYPIGGLMQVTSSSTSASYVDVAGKLAMFNKGDVVSVQLKYLRWDTTTGADTSVVSNVATVTCLDTAISGTSKWTISATNNTVDWTKITNSVAAEDNTKTLYVKVKDNYGTETVNTAIKFTSLDESILLVDKTNGNLYPLKAGVAIVKVESGDFVDYLTITVLNKQVSTKVVGDTVSYTLSNSTNLGAMDSKVVKFTLKDNYDATFNLTGNGTIRPISLSNQSAILVNGTPLAVQTDRNFVVTAGEGLVTFTAVAGQTGSATYLVTIDGKTTVVTIVVAAPNGATGYKVELSDNELDSFNNNSPEVANVSLYSVDAAGVKAAKLTAVSGSAITYTVKDSAGTVKVSAAFGATTQVTSANYANGTYTVYVQVGPVVASTTYTVKSTKLAAAYVLDKNSTTLTESSTILAAIQNCITAKVDGNAVADNTISVVAANYTNLNSGVTVAGPSAAIVWGNETVLPIYVKSITVTTLTDTYTVDVNAVITITK